jgi:hypothetical protein
MYICMYVYVFRDPLNEEDSGSQGVFTCFYIFIYMDVDISIWICVYVCMYVCMYVYVFRDPSNKEDSGSQGIFICIYIVIYEYIYVYGCGYVYMDMCICMYVCICLRYIYASWVNIHVFTYVSMVHFCVLVCI